MPPTAPSCSATTRRARPIREAEHGSIILFMIMALVLLGIVGTGMSRLFSGGAVETAVSVPAPNVQYVTETGYRLVASEFNNAAAGSRDDVLEDMHGKTFVLDADSGSQVTVRIHSYWLRITSISGNVITVEALSELPPMDFDNPGALIDVASCPKISINRSLPLTVTSITTNTTGSQHTAVITLSAAPPLASTGDSVYLVQDSGNSVSISGNDLLGLPADFDFFPPENGQFYLYDGNDTVYEYDSMDYNADGTVNLRGVTNLSGKTSSDFRSQDFILLKTLAMSCTGQYGTGSALAASQTETFYSRLDSSVSTTPGGSEYDLEVDFDNGDTSVLQPLPFNVSAGTVTMSTEHGDHDGFLEVTDAPVTVDEQTGQNIKETFVCLNVTDTLADYWTNSTRSLSYDVQVKMGNGWLQLYGAQGLSLRVDMDASGDPVFYGVSVMKYYDGSSGGDDDMPGFNDYIPDNIKPPGEGSAVRSWYWASLPGQYRNYTAYIPNECTSTGGGHGHGHGNNRACGPTNHPLSESVRTDKILIVFWQQYYESGKTKRRWLAYKDITDDVYAKGKQSSYDGRLNVDDMTLWVRVQELTIRGVKANYFKVYYGDGSSLYPTAGSRTANTVSYDIEQLRQVYLPSWSSSPPADYPAWPPYDMNTWPTTSDYMTFIRKAPVAYAATRGTGLCRWDGFNTAYSNEFSVMWDGGTIITTDFVTPSSGAFPSTRCEVCMHTFFNQFYDGWLSEFNEGTFFDELNMRILTH